MVSGHEQSFVSSNLSFVRRAEGAASTSGVCGWSIVTEPRWWDSAICFPSRRWSFAAMFCAVMHLSEAARDRVCGTCQRLSTRALATRLSCARWRDRGILRASPRQPMFRCALRVLGDLRSVRPLFRDKGRPGIPQRHGALQDRIGGSLRNRPSPFWREAGNARDGSSQEELACLYQGELIAENS